MPNNRNRINRRSYIKATGAGLALTAVAGCLGDDDDDDDDNGVNGDDANGADGTDDTGDDNGDLDDPVMISSLQPLSGVFAQYGPRHRDGADWAAEQLNANGGILGHEVELNHVDTASDGQEAADAFISHIEDGAIAGIGPGSSDAAIFAGNEANIEQVPLFLHAAGASANTPPDNEYVFRTNLAATPQSALSIAQMVEERGYTKGAAIYEEGEWGDEFRLGVEAYFPDDIELQTDSAPIPQSDFSPILQQFDDDIEFFMGTAHPPGTAQIYPQLIDLGFDVSLYTSAITPVEADYEELGSDMAEHDYCSFNQVDFYSEAYQDLARQYTEDTGDIFDTAQAGGYAAVMLTAQAAEAADSVDPVDIRDALVSESFDIPVYGPPVEYTEYGEMEGAVQIFNGIEEGDSPDYWPDVGFSPREIFRSDPLPAYAHELN